MDKLVEKDILDKVESGDLAITVNLLLEQAHGDGKFESALLYTQLLLVHKLHVLAKEIEKFNASQNR